MVPQPEPGLSGVDGNEMNDEPMENEAAGAADSIAEQEAQNDAKPLQKRNKRAVVSRPYPRKTLEQALRVPRAIKDHNGGNAWAPDQVARALDMGMSGTFFYLTAASRDFGLTEGTRDTSVISITDLGRRAVYPGSPEEEARALRDAFFNVDIFRKVVDHFGGSKLPEMRFLANTLQRTFDLDPALHDEFVDLFAKNCRFVGIGADYAMPAEEGSGTDRPGPSASQASRTVATPQASVGAPICFVIMPFTERHDDHPVGFFEEVLHSVFTPAITAAGFTVKTAKRSGSDIIQATIVTELLDADLVLADLTEHNPNVLFELGMRMAEDRPVALVRAKGTGQIFDVDNVLRVEDYNPNLWPSTVEKDVPRLTEHLLATWQNRGTARTFLKILRDRS